ncbi:hypothetical protein [Bdellovibrio sp. GT3]|uniref:hypothetical protein n=1 Tax=Bdellovibrio sp. GT3 TaxID=3136282 RepID=UPI0030F1C372
MQSSITKLTLTALISLMATQSFAGGGQVGSAETLAGTYVITGPTNEIGDENMVKFTPEGNIYLSQRSMGRNLNCAGQFQVRNRVLQASGLCRYDSGHSEKFEMSIELSDVTNLGYFRAPVLSETIYPKSVQMEFLLKK